MRGALLALPVDSLGDLLGPGLVFVLLTFWLVRKAVRAARTEEAMEEERLAQALRELAPTAPEPALRAAAPSARTPSVVEPAPFLLPPSSAPPAPSKKPSAPGSGTLASADVSGASDAHVAAVRALLEERDRAALISGTPVPRVEILWVRSFGEHVAWCERRHAATEAAAAFTRDVLCVAQVAGGKASGRWTFG